MKEVCSISDIEQESLNEIIQKSPYLGLETDIISQRIANDFNRFEQENRQTIMTEGYYFLFKHRMVQANEFRLVELNGVPELVPYCGRPQRREKILNFMDSSSTLGIYKQNTPLIGQNGRYVINVPAGQLAKVYDGTRALLLGEGQHVIHSPNFRFNPDLDLIQQNQNYINHNDIHILRVPPGQVAAVTVNNRSLILESREEPYVFRTQQFKIIPHSRESMFHPNNKRIIQVGTQVRLMPNVGEVAVINEGGHFKILENEANESGPMKYDLEQANFVNFLSTNIENAEFPSESVRRRHLTTGLSAKEAEYDYFYTKDAVKVGVRFFVGYRIKNPSLTLKHLSLEEISSHIEKVVNSDMGAAIQHTSIQKLLNSKLQDGAKRDSDGSAVNWQQEVHDKLEKDFEAYGIELVRLNIEESFICNKDIEKKMSEQALSVAQAHAEQAALATNMQIQEQKIQQQRELAIKQRDTDTELATKKADADLSVAQKEAEAIKIKRQAEIFSSEQQAKVFQENPEAFLTKLMEIFASIFSQGNFSSTLPVADVLSSFQNALQQFSKPMAKLGVDRNTLFHTSEEPLNEKAVTLEHAEQSDAKLTQAF